MELKKFEESRQRALDQRDAQNLQLEQLKQKILAEKAADRKEGLLLKQRAEKVGQQLVWSVERVRGCSGAGSRLAAAIVKIGHCRLKRLKSARFLNQM